MHEKRPEGSLKLCLARRGLLVALLALGMAPPVAAADPGAATIRPADPVLSDVVRLLESKLGEPLILRWLAESGQRPAMPSAADLVALKKAGASDELVAALLDRARSEAPGASATAPVAGSHRASPAATPEIAAATAAPVAAVPAEAAPPPSPVAQPVASATPPPAPAAPAPAALPAGESAGAAKVRTDLSLRYIHVPEEGDPWDLVVYVDGRPSEVMQAARSSQDAPTFTETRTLAPGPHVVRWAQEWHREAKSVDGNHAARFDNELLRFVLASGSAATIDFEFRDRTGPILRMGGPVDVSVSQAQQVVASAHTNNDPARWPLLCEDVEANLAGKKAGYFDRQTLRSCVRWAELWKDAPAPPGRDEVRPPLR